MTENALGIILLKNRLITQRQLDEALQKQQQLAKELRWQPLGEILVQSEVLTRRELSEVLERQAKLNEIEFFEAKLHPSVRSEFKRFLDVVGAFVGIAITVVLFPLIAIAICWDSPGPILFSQHRVGLRGKQFRIWKFRTMIPQAEAHKLQVAGDSSYKFFTCRSNDSRITRVGKFLRKTHLDEMPQFFNVLRGEMSLVGTRPPTLDEIKAYSWQDWQRLSIKPGMTGLWQVDQQKYTATFDEVLKFDLRYIQQWSHQLDISIILGTVAQLLRGPKRLPIKDSGGLEQTGFQKKVQILNVEIDNLSMVEVLTQLKSGVVLTPNVDHLMKLQRDAEFCRIYNLAQYRVCDSQILMYAARILGSPLKEKVSGSDLFPAFCKFHRDNQEIKVFLLGGDQGVANKARARINTIVGREIIIDSLSPSFGFEKNEQECLEIIDRINLSGATVLAVGVGAPKQEKWIFKYKDRLPNVNIFLAVGASIDFEAQTVKRSPKWMSAVGLEWLYRLASDPKRLWKRYLVDDVPFLGLLLKQRLGLYTPPLSTNSGYSEASILVPAINPSNPITKIFGEQLIDCKNAESCEQIS